ncbi:MAG TPA: hypothetical protein VFV52_18515, partial [Bacilli bacterium]|nr:hypothetical protein [Bacilli bacterium]
MAEEHEANQEHLNEDTMQVQKEEQKQEQKQERAQDQMQESIPKSIPESIQEPISEPIQKPPTSRRKPVRLWSLISLALGAGLLFAGYWYVLNSWYHQSYQPQELYREAESLVETHNSALRMEKGYPSTDARINPLLTQTITLKLYTNVGDREVIAGEVTVSKPLIGKVQVEYDLNQRYLDDDYTYSFPLPPSLFGTFYEMRDPGAQEAVWQQVAHIDDGHVAQMAFSTWLPMSPEQLLTNLQKYDLHVLDMPVFGGELKSFMSGFEMATTNRDTHYV